MPDVDRLKQVEKEETISERDMVNTSSKQVSFAKQKPKYRFDRVAEKDPAKEKNQKKLILLKLHASQNKRCEKVL